MQHFLKAGGVLFFLCGLLHSTTIRGQQTYPEPMLNQAFVPPSPNAQALVQHSSLPVGLYRGVQTIVLPVYTLKCGALSLPVSLTYNYNGLFSMQDAAWTGLGWSLDAGGAVTRMVRGLVDNSQNSGYNYGQYNLVDSLTGSNANNFLATAFNANLQYSGNSYDMAPDYYDIEFPGYADRFVWLNGKAYGETFDKNIYVSWPSPGGNITVTTTDGTIYTFGAQETTTDYYYGGSDSASQTYISSWFLTQIVSADHKDTIQLNYGTYTWQQQGSIPYRGSYLKSLGSQADIGSDPMGYHANPSVQMQVLQSIVCRNARVSFIPDGTARTDISGTMPRLREIDVVDSLTGNVVTRSTFGYEYFGQTATNPANYERLALKTYSSMNTLLPGDSTYYTFKYLHEYDSFPSKSNASFDYFGYCNGFGPGGLFPPNGDPYYMPAPTGANMGTANRTPNFTYSCYGLLDTLLYPTGGYTAFQYGPNYYYNSALGGSFLGPGNRVQSTTTFTNNPTSPQVIQRTYTYLQDSSSNTSGVTPYPPNAAAQPFVLSNAGVVYNYNQYVESTVSMGIGSNAPIFYYTKVSVADSTAGEIHKTDHYFNDFGGLYPDVRQTKVAEYVNMSNTSTFNLVNKLVTSYSQSADTSFTVGSVYIDSEYISTTHTPNVWYNYKAIYGAQSWSYWIYPTSQVTTIYDQNGDSLVKTLAFNYNPVTRNVAYTTQTTSDGQTLKLKYKMPEDYSGGLTGNMVAARVLSPVIEQQTWMYPSANDSMLIGGVITQYDQTLYKPVNIYTIELTKSIPVLNNETVSGGLYTNLLSDSRYVVKEQWQYDQNSNMNVAAKAAGRNFSFIWDYKHSLPIAEVSNAGPSDIAYTSFEADGNGNWTLFSPARDTGGVTGSNCYNLSNGSLSCSGLNSSTTYIASYWLRTSAGATASVSGSSSVVQGKTINGWTYYEMKFTGTTTPSVSGSGDIDELRVYPSTAQMKTYTYIPCLGVSSACDPDNHITYYQYDGFNRLHVVLDQDHNIIRTVQYHYQGETKE